MMVQNHLVQVAKVCLDRFWTVRSLESIHHLCLASSGPAACLLFLREEILSL